MTFLLLLPLWKNVVGKQYEHEHHLYWGVNYAVKSHICSPNTIHTTRVEKPALLFWIYRIPLSQCIQTPDVIISICNSYQAMRYIQGFTTLNSPIPIRGSPISSKDEKIAVFILIHRNPYTQIPCRKRCRKVSFDRLFMDESSIFLLTA